MHHHVNKRVEVTHEPQLFARLEILVHFAIQLSAQPPRSLMLRRVENESTRQMLSLPF